MRLNNLIYKIKSLLALRKLQDPCVNHEKVNVNTICIVLINIGLGDAIMATSFIRLLRESDKKVDVIVAKKAIPLFINNSDIDNLIPFGDKAIYPKNVYDLVIDPYSHCGWYATYKYVKLLSLLNYKYLSGFDVNIKNKYDDNYIPIDKNIHITEYYIHVAREIIHSSYVLPENYILPFGNKALEDAKYFIASLSVDTCKVAICPFASTPQRSFSNAQINEVLTFLECRKDLSIVLLMEKDKLSSVTLRDNSYFYDAPDFMSAAAVLCHCDFVVSVDTSFVHVANCGNKPALVFYSSVFNDGYNTDYLCGPNYPKARQVVEKNGVFLIKSEDIYDEINDYLNVLTDG